MGRTKKNKKMFKCKVLQYPDIQFFGLGNGFDESQLLKLVQSEVAYLSYPKLNYPNLTPPNLTPPNLTYPNLT